MPRTRRRTYPGVTYHVIARFIEERFYLDVPDARPTYLRLLGRSLERSDWSCNAYALMSSHVHLQLRAGASSFEAFLKRVHSPFANWLNRKLDRIGPAFASRPKTIAFLDENVDQLTAYIHNNPVRARVVARANETDWTSHRAYVGTAVAPRWLDTGRLRSNFDEFVHTNPGKKADPDPVGLRTELARRGAIDLATPAVARSSSAFVLVARRAAHVRPPMSAIVRVVADATGVRPSVLCSRRKLPAAVRARQVAARVAFELGLTTTDVAAGLGISGPAAHRLGQRQLDGALSRVALLATERVELEMWAKGAG